MFEAGDQVNGQGDGSHLGTTYELPPTGMIYGLMEKEIQIVESPGINYFEIGNVYPPSTAMV